MKFNIKVGDNLLVKKDSVLYDGLSYYPKYSEPFFKKIIRKILKKPERDYRPVIYTKVVNIDRFNYYRLDCGYILYEGGGRWSVEENIDIKDVKEIRKDKLLKLNEL